jgi:ubiquinone/menaquinone biosynthesis C-methylase UbiE
MKTEWDYINLSEAYFERPDYSASAVSSLIDVAPKYQKITVCDFGVGVAHLTLMKGKVAHKVTASEPNDEMRRIGKKRTNNFNDASWVQGSGEKTGLPENPFGTATFESSFNAYNRLSALNNVAQILNPKCWFSCMWNLRNLFDPIQAKIKKFIKYHIKGYGYGTPKEEQSKVIDKSELFPPTIYPSSDIVHRQPIEKCLKAWGTHATLTQQAGSKFNDILISIQQIFSELSQDIIEISLTTKIWIVQLR